MSINILKLGHRSDERNPSEQSPQFRNDTSCEDIRENNSKRKQRQLISQSNFYTQTYDKGKQKAANEIFPERDGHFGYNRMTVKTATGNDNKAEKEKKSNQNKSWS